MLFQFPYTNLYNLNLDWMIKAMKEMQEIVEPLDRVVNSVNNMTGDVTITKAFLLQILESMVSKFNGRAGDVTLTAADVNATMIDITWTSDPGDVIGDLAQNVRNQLYAIGKRILIFVNNQGVPDQIYFLTLVGDVVTPQIYSPTAALAGVASFNGQTGAVTATGSDLDTANDNDTPISESIEDLQTAVSNQSQQIDELGDTDTALESGIAIIVDGDTATQEVPAGGYAYIKNNTHGLSEGLYFNKTTAAFPENGGIATNTFFQAVSKGGLNEFIPTELTITKGDIDSRSLVYAYKINKIVFIYLNFSFNTVPVTDQMICTITGINVNRKIVFIAGTSQGSAIRCSILGNQIIIEGGAQTSVLGTNWASGTLVILDES